MSERPVELTGANALTQEEARVILSGAPFRDSTEPEIKTWRTAMKKLAQARNVTKRKDRRQGRPVPDREEIPRFGGVKSREHSMFGGYRLVVAHDEKNMGLAYFTVLHPTRRRLAGTERTPRVSCAADLDGVEELLAHLQVVHDDLAAAKGRQAA